ncbi:MAG: OmpA family protein [Bacteroidia bacterium]|nr:OmpA family protein [Bacteroidia bacterium]
MNKLTYTMLIILLPFVFFSQSFGDRLMKRAENRLKQKVENSVDKAVSKTYDKAEKKAAEEAREAIKKDNKKGKEEENNQTASGSNSGNNGNVTSGISSSSSGSGSTGNNTLNPNSDLKVYSKFDFIPGDKIIASEDFMQDNIGDFPAKWNTNGSGEVVTLNNEPTRYLKTNSEVIFYPEWVTNLPDNFTVEFDLICSDEYSYYSGHFVVGFTSEKNIGNRFKNFNKFGNGRIENGGGVEIAFHPQGAGLYRGMTSVYSSKNAQEILKNNADLDNFVVKNKKNKIHVSIWRQKQRVRVYVNEKKVWDLPRVYPEGLSANSIYFRHNGCNPEKEAYFFGNLKVAVEAPDTRSKLITEGKLSTTAIKFDSGSDQLKPESYGILKEISDILNQNPEVRVKIIGHTDNQGKADFNLELSKKRAAAVKSALVQEFGIEASRMESDGKGQTEPVDKNDIPEGRANNRRVEFIKI